MPGTLELRARTVRKSVAATQNVRIVLTGESLATDLDPAAARDFCRRWNAEQRTSATWAACESGPDTPRRGRPADPTPGEIALRAAEIRHSWTPAEERRRNCWPVERWTAPTASLCIPERAAG